MVAMEPVVQSQAWVGMEVEQEVGYHPGVPGDLKPHNQPRPLWMCCWKLPLIFAVSELALYPLAICGVPLLPHPVEAAVEPVAHSSRCYASVASTSHPAVEQHSEQLVYLYVVVAVQQEEEDWLAHL